MIFALLLLFAIIALSNRDFDKYDSSVIGPPGLSVNPLVSSLNARIIWLTEEGNSRYIKEINQLLEPHRQLNCTDDTDFCGFDAKNLGPCAVEPYGYEGNNEPFCVYLLINKIFHWVPECHNNSLSLPLQMPVELKGTVQNMYALHPDTKINMVWISCIGHEAVDRDNIGHIDYFPYPGFDSSYFPHRTQPGSSPIVGAMFYGATPEALITVRCHLFAKNIPHHYHSLFQIYIDRR